MANPKLNDPFWLDKAVLKAIALIIAFMLVELGMTRLRMIAEQPNPVRRPIERPARRPAARPAGKRWEHPIPATMGIRG